MEREAAFSIPPAHNPPPKLNPLPDPPRAVGEHVRARYECHSISCGAPEHR